MFKCICKWIKTQKQKHNNKKQLSMTGVGKLQPAGQMRPSKPKSAAREVLFSNRYTFFGNKN